MRPDDAEPKRILSMIPAPGWRAIYENSGAVVQMPLVAWALVVDPVYGENPEIEGIIGGDLTYFAEEGNFLGYCGPDQEATDWHEEAQQRFKARQKKEAESLAATLKTAAEKYGQK